MAREGRDLDRQLTMRLGAAEMERLEELAQRLAAVTPGLEVSRSSAARAALLVGLEALEAKLGAGPTKPATKKPKR